MTKCGGEEEEEVRGCGGKGEIVTVCEEEEKKEEEEEEVVCSTPGAGELRNDITTPSGTTSWQPDSVQGKNM